MPQPILLRGARQLLTLRGPAGARRGAALRDLAIIEDGSILIRDGKIAHVGTTRRIENLKEARDALDIPVHGCVVMPGFIDPGLNLGLEPGETAERQTARKRKRPAELHTEALQLVRACQQHGTLAAELKASAEAEDFRSDLGVLRQLSRIGAEAANTWKVSWKVSFAGGELDFKEALEIVARRKLVRSIELELAPKRTPKESVFDAIDESGLKRNLCWRGGSLQEVLARFQPQSVFCPEPLDANECRALAESSAMAVFSPGENTLSGEGDAISSVRDLADDGGAIALSSGYDARSMPSFSMQMVVALAVFRLKLWPEEAISAATINAACASGCGETAGSLECGKRGNVLVLDISDYRDLPRQFGVNHVAIAIRDGAVVFSRNRWKAGAA